MSENKNVLKLGLGVSLSDAADLAIKMAKQKKSGVILTYNNVDINVLPDTTQKYVINAFFSQAATMPNMAMQQKQRG